MHPSWPEGFPAILAGDLSFSYQRKLKSSFPYVAAQDYGMKAGIFPGELIAVEGGRQVRQKLYFC
jgi:hypothetical protein